MLVSSSKLSVMNLAWVVGALVFVLAVAFPPLPVLAMDHGSGSGWVYDFFQVAAYGGIAPHLLSYLQGQAAGQGPWSGRTLFATFAPYCFVPAVLPLCAIMTWHWLVSRPARPTMLRGVLAVFSALVLSLLVIFLLDWVGGRALLFFLSVSAKGDVMVKSLIAYVWTVATAQSAWFVLPCLVIGGVLASFQEMLWLRYSKRQGGKANLQGVNPRVP